jgi:hypothetical protein
MPRSDAATRDVCAVTTAKTVGCSSPHDGFERAAGGSASVGNVAFENRRLESMFIEQTLFAESVLFKKRTP